VLDQRPVRSARDNKEAPIRLRVFLFSVVAAALTGFPLAHVPEGQATATDGSLFTPLIGTEAQIAPPTPDDGPGLMRTRAVELNHSLLDPRTAPSRGHRLVLNLFDDVSLTAVLNVGDTTQPGLTVWNGTVEGSAVSNVVFTAREGVVQGSILSGRTAYQVR